MAPKPSVQARQVISAMEEFEARLMAKLADQTTQVSGLAEVKEQLGNLGMQFTEQVDRLDQLQVKVDLSMTSLAEVRNEHAQLARTQKVVAPTPPPPPLQIPPKDGAGLMGSRPRTSTQQQVSFTSPSVVSPGVDKFGEGSSGSKKSWVTKMDFPWFDGSRPSIWLDQCNDYFKLYQITDSFKVTAASKHMVEDAAMWFQSYKRLYDIQCWDAFCATVLGEFDIDVHRSKMREILQLR